MTEPCRFSLNVLGKKERDGRKERTDGKGKEGKKERERGGRKEERKRKEGRRERSNWT